MCSLLFIFEHQNFPFPTPPPILAASTQPAPPLNSISHRLKIHFHMRCREAVSAEDIYIQKKKVFSSDEKHQKKEKFITGGAYIIKYFFLFLFLFYKFKKYKTIIRFSMKYDPSTWRRWRRRWMEVKEDF